MKRTYPVIILAAVMALAGSFVAELVHSKALASRNSSGTYSLPSGNPVTTGTTISSTWANTTLADIGTELTNSLDRSGRGAMTAPLQHSSGTVSSPSLTFSADPASGLYRAGAGDVRMSVTSTDIMKWLVGGVIIPGTLGVTGTTTLSGPAVLSSTLTVAGKSTVHALASGQVLDFQNTTGAIAITHATDQPELHMCDFAADAGAKCGRVIYDPGASLPVNKPGWVFQRSTDDGGFVSNGLIVYRDGALGIGPGDGTMISASYGASYTIDFPNTNDGACSLSSQSLAGVSVGGVCSVSADYLGAISLATWTDCHVTGANTVVVRFCNADGAPTNPASASYRVRVFQP